MRSKLLAVVLVLCIASSSVFATPPPGYVKVWEDTFSGTSLDTNNWSIGCKDDVSGDIIPGALGTYLLNNGYDAYITAEDVYVSGGNLYLRNQKRSYTGTDPAGSYEYTTGWINTMHKVSFNKGYVEFRAQFPSGDKVWPALWLIAEDLNWGPEWDLWEYFGWRWDTGYDAMMLALMTGNWQNPNWYSNPITSFDATYDCEAWHIYGFEWTADYAKWYLDGAEVNHINASETMSWPNEDMYFVLNNSTKTDSSDTSTTWPNQLVIDYVELYEVGTGPDIYPPFPDPIFALDPYGVGDDSIIMSSAIPGDASPPIEYYFTCTLGGGTDSGWQTGNTYTDSGLLPNTQYSYTITTRDSLGNTGTPSAPFTLTTNEAGTLAVLNHSFEYVNGQAVLDKVLDVTPDNWTFANANGDGIEWPESHGEVCVALINLNSVYQTLGHTIAEGDAFELKFDAYYLWAESTYDCTFRGILYYLDGASRVPISYSEDRLYVGMPDLIWHLDYTLNTAISAGHPAIGKQLGVELAIVDTLGYTFGFDNVRIKWGQPSCGNVACEVGEDQCNCPADCGAPTATETDCTDGKDNDCDGLIDCTDSDCAGPPSCPSCGDTFCDGDEDQCNCPTDCGTPPSTESSCTDGVDNDCDAAVDCGDADCDADPGCGSIYADGFESGDFATGGWTTAGTAEISRQAAYTGDNGAKLSGIAQMETAIDTTGLGNTTLKYVCKVKGLDQSQGEELTVEWFDGTYWYTVNQTRVADWTPFGHSLGAGANNNPNFKIRFKVDANMGSESASIDDVEVVGGSGSSCGDATCDPSEDQCNCAADCGTPPATETNCTDGIDEDCDTDTDCDDADCLGDPACPSCGDLTCDPGEDQCNCPGDCGTPPATETNCTDGINEDCDANTDCNDSDCASDPACQSACNNNGTCETGEDCNNCPNDCISKTNGNPSSHYCCGDGTCEGAEDSTNCAVDCGSGPVCGDGTCDPGEDNSNCPADCPPSACNNNSICEPGEDCLNCANDCDGVTGGNPNNRYCCGNGTVEPPEGDGTICDGNY